MSRRIEIITWKNAHHQWWAKVWIHTSGSPIIHKPMAGKSKGEAIEAAKREAFGK